MNNIATPPFSITLFATTGDPQGIRHVDKSNWSGFGVVFTKELFKQLKHEPGYNQAGVYLLVGDAAEDTLYIGEADPLGERLKTHVAKRDDWNWGVYFFDKNHKIGKTEVRFLEHALLDLAKQHNRVILLNKNQTSKPSMSAVAKATADVFLADMLLILPMLGINAFSPANNNNDDSDSDKDTGNSIVETKQILDTVVVPAREDGFQQRFIAENRWFAIRIGERYLTQLKYIVAYRVAPMGAITHIAEIDTIKPYGDTGKYELTFKAAAEKIIPIPRTEDSKVSMQSPRYALMKTLRQAKNLDEVFN